MTSSPNGLVGDAVEKETESFAERHLKDILIEKLDGCPEKTERDEHNNDDKPHIRADDLAQPAILRFFLSDV
jgi:hypothetical protein